MITPAQVTMLREQIRSWLISLEATTPPLGIKSKHIRDPLHGSIVLSPHEVRLLDSVLMQRLRGIHQLGLAYLTFPSAHHTRLEHSLGVRFVAEQIIRRLEDVRGPYNSEHRTTVLAAALLHDVGHGVFSHATEAMIGDYPYLRDQYDPDGGALHEQIGAILITEPPLANCLVEMGIDPYAVAALIRHDTVTLESLQVPPELWGVISGPLDADKLDYFARDSYFSGVVSAVDPDRILRTLTIGPNAQLAITMAGASALDQMLYDRVRMYSDLYGHQKILAAETMVRGMIETMLRRELLRTAFTLSYESVQGMSEESCLHMLYKLREKPNQVALRQQIHAQHPELAIADIGVVAVRRPTMDGVATSIVGRDGLPVTMGSMFEGWSSCDESGMPTNTILRHFELYRSKVYFFCPPHAANAVSQTVRELLRADWGDNPGALL